MRYHPWFCMAMAVFSHGVSAQDVQDEERNLAIEQVMELVAENLETEDLDFTTYLDDLHYYYAHPLNLNRASREDLQRLLILDDFQVEALLDHIRYTGKMISLYELQGIAGFDLHTVATLLPFVHVGDGSERVVLNRKAIGEHGSHEMFIRCQRVLEEMEGFSEITDSAYASAPNSRYLGSPERILTRYRFRYLNVLSMGITAEKDAGEQFFTGTQRRGFDFYSAHLYFGNYGIVKHAIIGDYQVQFGQGLTWWTGLAFGKSAGVTTVKRSAREIAPHLSADENNFMRGAAATLAFGAVEVTAFASSKRVDANLTPADSAPENEIPIAEFSSFQNSGYHRTPGELEDRDAIGELNTGGHVRLIRDHYQIGITGVYTKYSGSQPGEYDLYRRFEPLDNPFMVAGFDYQYMIRNVLGFGEVSHRPGGGPSFLNGAILSLDRNFDVSVLHRYYDPAYNAPRSNAFSESTRNINESGFYFGFSARLHSRWTLNGYYDLFAFPWLRYQTDAPSNGREYLAQLEYRPGKRFSAYARYRVERKSRNHDSETQATAAVGLLQRQWYRLHWQYTLGKDLSLRNRLEFVQTDLPEGIVQHGWLILQDIVYKPAWPAKYTLKLRYAMFDTDGYDSRIYAYESDVPYSFSVPAYYHRGSRFYLILGYDITRWCDLTVRVSQTWYANQKESGSGLNTIAGPTRTELKVQLRLRF